MSFNLQARALFQPTPKKKPDEKGLLDLCVTLAPDSVLRKVLPSAADHPHDHRPEKVQSELPQSLCDVAATVDNIEGIPSGDRGIHRA